MPTYTTPIAIDLAINLQVGAIDVIASDRADTVVTVSASNPDRAADRRGVESTTADFDGQRLTITGPKPRFSMIGPTESVDLLIELPTGSRLTVKIAVGGVHTIGRLGATRMKSSMGPIDVDATGDLWLRAGHGSVTVGSVDGGAEVTADHGPIRIGAIKGDSLLKASHGAIWVEEAGGELEAKLSYGDLDIGRALTSVTAKTAYGSITLPEVSNGSIAVESAFGQITIGVRQGVAAWLDLASKLGHIRNELDGHHAPKPSEQSVAVRARTQGGNISIHHAR